MSTGVQARIGAWVWHENHSTDPERAGSFYTDLLGWTTEPWKEGGDVDYTIIKSGDTMQGGFMAAQGGAPSRWLGHVLVEDVDETARSAEAAGGKIVAGPMDMPEVGRFALIADPQGAVFSIFGSSNEEGGEPSQGVFVWDELHTSDPPAAKSFYGEVLGWTTKDADMGGVTYTIFKRAGDVDAGGCFPHGEGTASHWLVYIGTDDVDGKTARAKELGATVHIEPSDIPNMGRFSVLQDPTGAVFGLYQGS